MATCFGFAEEDFFEIETVKWFNYIIKAGIGFTTGSTLNFWENDFNYGPIVNVGIELPLTKTHFWAFEFSGFYWISSLQEKLDDDFYHDEYLYLGNYTYSQLAFSAMFKLYTNNKDDFMREYFQAGWFLLSPNRDIGGMEFGYGILFNLSTDISLSLTRKLLIGGIDFGGRDLERMPNSVLLNYNHRILW